MTTVGGSGVTPRGAHEQARRALPGTVTVIVGPRLSGRSWVIGQLETPDTVTIRGRAAEANHALLAAAPLLGDVAGDNLSAQLTTARAQLGDDGILLVDDAQFLDEATADLLGAIAGRAGEWDLTVIVATDSTEAAARYGTTPLVLAPLSAGTSPSEIGLSADQEDFDAIIAATGGWPGLVLAHHAGGLDATLATILSGLSPNAAEIVDRLAWGASAADDSLAGSDLEPADVDAALEEAARNALLVGGEMPSGVAGAVRAATPPARRRDVAEVVLAHGSDEQIVRLADHLVDVGDRSDLAHRVLVTAARRHPAGPASVELFERAAALGDLEPTDQRRLAAGLAAMGRTDDAGALLTRLLDDGHTDPDICLLAAATAVAGERLVDALDLVERVAAEATDHPVTALLPWFRAAVGIEASEHDAASLGSSAAVHRFAQAAAGWLATGGEDRLDILADAARAAADLDSVDVWPQHPLETVAAAATIARDAEASTIAADLLATAGRDAAARQRFVAMRAGRLADAAVADAEARSESESTPDEPPQVSPRDQSLAKATELGLALRQQAGDQLEAELDRPRMLLTRLQPDLWATDVLAELALVTGRLHGLDEAHRLLDRVEDLTDTTPSSPARFELAWTRLMAAVLGDDVEATVAAATTLAAMPAAGEVPVALGEAAAVFKDVFSGKVDPEIVEATTNRLKTLGLPFEASHLAAAAALRCSDETATRSLLSQSRKLRGDRRRTRVTAPDVDALSDREVDVARLVVLGRTHKEIGAELFISPKTVEHHVARVRRKLGATNRAEMLASITNYLDTIDT